MAQYLYHHYSSSLASRSSQDSHSYSPPLYTNTTHPGAAEYDSNNAAADLNNNDPVSPIMSRSPSVASDRFSTVSGLTGTFPPNPADVYPAPAYIAPFGATQVVSEHRGAGKRSSSSEEEDEAAKPDKDDVRFSPESLTVINAFLDQLLFSFLSAAKSTSLYALRPAVTEILRNRLARDAIASADEELQELLAGNEEDDEKAAQNSSKDNRRWDLELVWKRTRLRVMVYMRLGEMEDEDEERYVKEQELFINGADARRFSSTAGLVSWSAAIFLTSVLEFVAEQTLQVAGSAAYTRLRRQSRTAGALGHATKPDPVEVEEQDAERVALNPQLGRLWRTWRKTLRGTARPGTPTQQRRFSRTSREGINSALSNYRESNGSATEGGLTTGAVAVDSEAPQSNMMDKVLEVPDDQNHPEHILASNIPLPMGDTKRDVDEIEVPGLAKDLEEDGGDGVTTLETPALSRRRSFTDSLRQQNNALLPSSVAGSSQQTPKSARSKPVLTRQRSMSVPTPARIPLPSGENRFMPGAFPEEPVEEQVQPGVKQKDRVASIAEEKEDTPTEAALDQTVDRDGTDEGIQKDSKRDDHTLDAAAQENSKSEEHILEAAAAVGGAAVAGAAVSESTISKWKPETTKSERDIEDLDRRKSLLDLKSMIAQDGGPTPSREGSRTPRQVETPAALAETTSTDTRPESPASEHSYNLRNKDDKEVVVHRAERQHMDEPEEDNSTADEIGVARTSDMAVESASTTPSQMSPVELDGQEIEAPAWPNNRSSRFITAGVPNGTPEDTQNSFAQKRDTPVVLKPSDRTQDERRNSQRTSVPLPSASFMNGGSYPRMSSGEKPVYEQVRKSSTGTRDGARPKSFTSSRKERSSSQVQEHPALHRKSGSEATGLASLTSASIKGPHDFDMFLQGNRPPVKYTLTPETVRDTPSASNAASLAKLSGEGTPLKVHRSPSTETRAGRSQVSKQVTANAPHDDSSRSEKQERRKSISRPPPRNTSTSRSGLTAREPQVVTESTRDFADFIRSTGPQKDQQVYPVLTASRSSTSLHTLHATSGDGSIRAQSPGYERTKSLSQSVMDAENIPPVPVIPSKGKSPSRGKSPLQARGATDARMGSDDLINFIRDGPEDGQHRISRSVAPFRTTMDSDQFDDLGNNPAFGPPTDAVRQKYGPTRASSISGSSTKAPSTRNSATSRSALLNGSGNTMAPPATVHPAFSGQAQRLNANNASSLAPGENVSRKQYRNKDPYAIDMSDEDDDLLTALPRNKRKEESLADFLRNAEPPQDNGPRPLSVANTAQARSMANNSNNNNPNRPRGASITSQTLVGSSDQHARTRSLQNNSTAQRSGGSVTSLPSALKQQNGNNNALPPRTSSRPMEGRHTAGARTNSYNASTQSNTRDLAEFLRTSGPPAGSAPSPVVGKGRRNSPGVVQVVAGKQQQQQQQQPQQKKKRGFFSFFSRNRGEDGDGGGVRTYMDMP